MKVNKSCSDLPESYFCQHHDLDKRHNTLNSRIYYYRTNILRKTTNPWKLGEWHGIVVIITACHPKGLQFKSRSCILCQFYFLSLKMSEFDRRLQSDSNSSKDIVTTIAILIFRFSIKIDRFWSLFDWKINLNCLKIKRVN